MTSDATPRRTSRWVMVTAAVGIALVGVGSVTLWRAEHRTIGWFAYAPLSETVYSPAPLFADRRLGLVLVVVGALVLGATIGFVVGRRRRA